jgi:hypothetical protein
MYSQQRASPCSSREEMRIFFDLDIFLQSAVWKLRAAASCRLSNSMIWPISSSLRKASTGLWRRQTGTQAIYLGSLREAADDLHRIVICYYNTTAIPGPQGQNSCKSNYTNMDEGFHETTGIHQWLSVSEYVRLSRFLFVLILTVLAAFSLACMMHHT